METCGPELHNPYPNLTFWRWPFWNENQHTG